MQQSHERKPNVSRFADLMRVAARRAPSAIALVADSGLMSYGQLLERAQRLAQGLLRCGLAPGDAVGVLSRNRPE